MASDQIPARGTRVVRARRARRLRRLRAVRWLATLCAGGATAVGLLAAVRALGWWSSLGLVFSLAILAVLVTNCVACVTPVSTLAFVRSAAWTSVAGLALWGLVLVSPWAATAGCVAGLVELVLVHLTPSEASPPEDLRARTTSSSVVATADLDAVVAAELVRECEDLQITEAMTDADVCRAWRSSFVALERAREAGSLEAQLRVTRFRASLLDDLERRQPRGFAAWISSGPRAAGDPSRHLTC